LLSSGKPDKQDHDMTTINRERTVALVTLMAATPTALASFPTDVPEPGILSLFGAATIGLLLIMRYRGKK
jgi:hypothetical protein